MDSARSPWPTFPRPSLRGQPATLLPSSPARPTPGRKRPPVSRSISMRPASISRAKSALPPTAISSSRKAISDKSRFSAAATRMASPSRSLSSPLVSRAPSASPSTRPAPIPSGCTLATLAPWSAFLIKAAISKPAAPPSHRAPTPAWRWPLDPRSRLLQGGPAPVHRRRLRLQRQ